MDNPKLWFPRLLGSSFHENLSNRHFSQPPPYTYKWRNSASLGPGLCFTRPPRDFDTLKFENHLSKVFLSSLVLASEKHHIIFSIDFLG